MSDQKEFTCARCKENKVAKETDWKEIYLEPKRGANIKEEIIYVCDKCGAEVCSSCKKKYIKTSSWAGWEKALCPVCGESFAPDIEEVIRRNRGKKGEDSGKDTSAAEAGDRITRNFAKSASNEEILLEIDIIENNKSNGKKGIQNLVLTLLFFLLTGIFSFDIKGLFIITGVLLVHELGHLIAMKAFGYKNLQMFFIPLFGAAVSGVSRRISPAKEGIVALSGPLPGIFLGIISVIMGLKSNNSLLIEIGETALFINLFNMMPVLPFDGGRFVEIMITNRNIVGEILLKAAGAILFMFLIPEGGIVMFVPVIIILASISFGVKEDKVAKEFRGRIKGDEGQFLDLEEDIQHDIINSVIRKFSRSMNAKNAATYAISIFKRTKKNKIKASERVWAVLVYLIPTLVATFLYLTIGVASHSFLCDNNNYFIFDRGMDRTEAEYLAAGLSNTEIFKDYKEGRCSATMEDDNSFHLDISVDEKFFEKENAQERSETIDKYLEVLMNGKKVSLTISSYSFSEPQSISTEK